MNKHIPYSKLSKKKKREQDLSRRSSWENVNPVTRKIESKKLYNRKKVSPNDLY